MKDSITIVGMDVHKNSIEIALAETDGSGEVRHYGRIGGTMKALDSFIRLLISTRKNPRFVYEAGPCGFEIYRHLTKKGLSCKVIAPSLIPKRSGVRIKNDKRDAIMLARLERAGELTEVIVPSEEDEAIRDLTRAREHAVKARKVARQELTSFLLRQGKRYPGKGSWGPSHMRWLSDISMDNPIQQIVLQESVNTVIACTERLKRLENEIEHLLPGWRMYPAVKALQALRGVAFITAATTIAETGDMNRFPSARQFMTYLGLIPSEDTTGESVRRGKITKTGNSHIRRVLVEAARGYSHNAQVTRKLMKRQEDVPEHVAKIAWKAQKRLCRKYRMFLARGKENNKTVVAIARELAGFIWAIARQVPIAA